MKIISWNVAGLRACLKKGFADFFEQEKADIYCLQETKLLQEQLTFHPQGYFEYLYPAERKGYSGTMIYKNSYEYEAEAIFETLSKGSFMSEITPLSEEYLHVYFVVPEDVWSDITGTIKFKINVDGILLQGSLDDLL